MNSAISGPTFILIWFGFLLLVVVAIALFLVWGIRTGQFTDQKRARSLPLDAGIPGDDDAGKARDRKEGRGVGP